MSSPQNDAVKISIWFFADISDSKISAYMVIGDGYIDPALIVVKIQCSESHFVLEYFF